jgi:hypothetical protein
MKDWLEHSRGTLYALTNLAASIAILIGWSTSSAPGSLVVYVVLLFALCSMPLLWLQQINGRYALLAIFMGVYFLLFGAVDLRDLIIGADPIIDRGGSFTLAQIGVLLGGVTLVAGYRLAAQLSSPKSVASRAADWPTASILATGIVFFVTGTAAMAYLNLVVITENSIRATEDGYTELGPLLTFTVMLGQMVQPLGVVILAYGFARTRSFYWGLLIAALVLVQMVLGFLTDTKGTVLLPLLLVVVTISLLQGRISKGWIVGVIVFATIMFPVLQANRVVRSERGWNRAQVLEHIGTVVEQAFAVSDKVYQTRGGERSQTFLERVSGDAVLETLFSRVTESGSYLNGATVAPVAYAFVPRLILPQKADVPLGQLFNRTFMHGSKDDFLYLSVSILGELYWNFGWPGVLLGNFLVGCLLGLVGVKTDLAETPTLTRMLILLLTFKLVVLGYGDSIAMAFVTWLRCLAAIGLLHLLFSRPKDTQEPSEAGSAAVGTATVTGPVVRFPNLMR